MTATILAGLVGLAVGGLLNVVITRLAEEDPQGDGRPGCPCCHQPLPLSALIPLLNWVRLRGRCPWCGAILSPRYPLVETAAALMALALWARFPKSPLLWLYGPFAAALLVLTVLDLHYLWLPDVITLPGTAVGLAAAALFPQLEAFKALLGALGGWAFFQGVRWGYGKLSRGARQGVGGGDAKLMAFIGAVLGIQALPWVLLSGATLGGLAGLARLLHREQGRLAPLPYGPFLAVGALSFLFFGR
jgi:leader peptidase (prepilin peptidase)/N-methyltransferase